MVTAHLSTTLNVVGRVTPSARTIAYAATTPYNDYPHSYWRVAHTSHLLASVGR